MWFFRYHVGKGSPLIVLKYADILTLSFEEDNCVIMYSEFSVSGYIVFFRQSLRVEVKTCFTKSRSNELNKFPRKKTAREIKKELRKCLSREYAFIINIIKHKTFVRY